MRNRLFFATIAGLLFVTISANAKGIENFSSTYQLSHYRSDDKAYAMYNEQQLTYARMVDTCDFDQLPDSIVSKLIGQYSDGGWAITAETIHVIDDDNTVRFFVLAMGRTPSKDYVKHLPPVMIMDYTGVDETPPVFRLYNKVAAKLLENFVSFEKLDKYKPEILAALKRSDIDTMTKLGMRVLVASPSDTDWKSLAKEVKTMWDRGAQPKIHDPNAASWIANRMGCEPAKKELFKAVDTCNNSYKSSYLAAALSKTRDSACITKLVEMIGMPIYSKNKQDKGILAGYEFWSTERQSMLAALMRYYPNEPALWSKSFTKEFFSNYVCNQDREDMNKFLDNLIKWAYEKRGVKLTREQITPFFGGPKDDSKFDEIKKIYCK